MSRHPQPTVVAQMKGADRKDPQRYRGRAREPKPVAGLLPIPEHLDGARKAIWVELEAQIATGVLTHQDTAAFELMVSLFHQFRDDPTGISAIRLTTLISLLSRFGMTPADRTRIKVSDDPDRKENPFSKFGAA